MDQKAYPAHNVFEFDDGVRFSSNFDNGNLARVERSSSRSHEFRIWTSSDCAGEPFQAKNSNAWFHFLITGLPAPTTLRIQIVNASNHSGLYKHDMRPVYRSNSTNQRWTRLKNSVRFAKQDDTAQLYFEHTVETTDDKLFFAFTYPYTYSMVLNDLTHLDKHQNNFEDTGSIFYQRELLTNSCDGRRIELLTITSVDGASSHQHEELLSGLFPETRSPSSRPPVFPDKEIVFVSARVHPGEVPAQHTFKGILNLLMDKDDLRAQQLRRRYVFKMIPMLNPDGVFRGHFRLDQFGENLNRYYTNPSPELHPSIFGAKSLLDLYATMGKLALYLDFHAHASKRGCFIYGNVLPTVEEQLQNQLFCRLISLNSAHFDYEGCLFSREHMARIDPGDLAKGLTAEGSGRVNTYLAHGLIHSYTIECNYNTSRVGNEITPTDGDPGGVNVTPPSPYTSSPEKYTPSTYAGVGRACVIALLDIRGHNPCSRLPTSKLKSLERLRQVVLAEVRLRKEYKNQQSAFLRERKKSHDSRLTPRDAEEAAMHWRRVVGAAAQAAAGPGYAGPGSGPNAGMSCKDRKPPVGDCGRDSRGGFKEASQGPQGQPVPELPSPVEASRKTQSQSLSPFRRGGGQGGGGVGGALNKDGDTVQESALQGYGGGEDSTSSSGSTRGPIAGAAAAATSISGDLITGQRPNMRQRSIIAVSKKGSQQHQGSQNVTFEGSTGGEAAGGLRRDISRGAGVGESVMQELRSDKWVADPQAATATATATAAVGGVNHNKLPPRPPLSRARGAAGGKKISKTLQAAGVALLMTKKLKDRKGSASGAPGSAPGSAREATERGRDLQHSFVDGPNEESVWRGEVDGDASLASLRRNTGIHATRSDGRVGATAPAATAATTAAARAANHREVASVTLIEDQEQEVQLTAFHPSFYQHYSSKRSTGSDDVVHVSSKAPPSFLPQVRQSQQQAIPAGVEGQGQGHGQSHFQALVHLSPNRLKVRPDADGGDGGGGGGGGGGEADSGGVDSAGSDPEKSLRLHRLSLEGCGGGGGGGAIEGVLSLRSLQSSSPPKQGQKVTIGMGSPSVQRAGAGSKTGLQLPAVGVALTGSAGAAAAAATASAATASAAATAAAIASAAAAAVDRLDHVGITSEKISISKCNEHTQGGEGCADDSTAVPGSRAVVPDAANTTPIVTITSSEKRTEASSQSGSNGLGIPSISRHRDDVSTATAASAAAGIEIFSTNHGNEKGSLVQSGRVII